MTALDPQALAERLVAGADGDDCAVVVRHDSTANLRWARNLLTTNGRTESTSVSLVAFVRTPTGVAAGTVTRTGPAAADVDSLWREARATARESGDAEDAGPLVEGVAADPDWADSPAVTSADALAGTADGLGEVLVRGRADDVEQFGYAEHRLVTTYLASSRGVRLRHVQPEGRLEATAKSHGRTRSAWAGRATRWFDDVDPREVDEELRRGLSWQGRVVDVPPGRHTALLTPSAVADLVIDLYWSAGLRDARDGRSVFSRPGGGTRLGDTLTPLPLLLHSDPGLPGMECSPFEAVTSSSSMASVFDDGLPLGPTAWVHDGRLAALVGSRHEARAAGVPATPGIGNLAMSLRGAHGSVDDLVARTERGLLVTCLWYNRLVDPQTLLLTGLTRDGVYLVDGGEVVGTVGNYRFNDSPVGMLGRIADAGDTVRTLPREMADYVNRVAAPPLLVADFHFSTRSDAV
ncbi:MAG: metallopeptidase TldD-related protein [Candidatus Nanopelagicales bacterium]